jgi:hypothetical protein
MTEPDRIPTLAEVAVTNLRRGGKARTRSLVEASKACALVWAWAETTRSLGRPPTRAEHSKHWKESDRTTYRDLEVFRRAFPTERDPQNLANWLNANVERRSSEAGTLGLESPAWLRERELYT